MPPERDDVRRAFARIATNVAVVTAPGPAGCTANVWAEAFEPPVLLVTLKRDGQTHGSVLEAGRFTVHLLADDQRDVARRFAGPRSRRFADGAPSGALATIECTVRAVHWFGAHDIVVGDVERVAVREDGRPLLFADSRFLP